MVIFKCKMCGGTLEVNQGESVGVCEYCGTKQTLPKLDDERKTNLYDRANHFRRNNDYDKAMGIYEQILSEDNTDAEAYWSLVLCKYGIEYVEDPATHKRVPTVNRAQYTSVFADEDYKSAIQYADGYQKDIYEAEAKAIDEIQKGILEISQKEEPFDVFICYKETGADGRRTPDSVLATELYHELTREGFNVFFSHITLEDKLGTAYEPYIFAALNSAKVMVVLGTKAEHFNAVWVKNEWSRFLTLIKAGARKTLIPAYKDMDPYDLPEEFSHLQAQDMSKLGFMQDLLRGIKKIAKADEPKTAVKETVVMGGNANTAPLLKRAFMFLEDGEWAKADDFCEQVLNQDPENAEAYLGKLMAELQVNKAEQLETYSREFGTYSNFQKAVRFGDKEFKERMENYRLTQLYNAAVAEMNKADSETEYKVASALFEKISGFKDADELAKLCLEKAEECRKDSILADGKLKMSDDSIYYYEEAIKIFRTISGWRDADEQTLICQKRIEEIKAKQEKERLEKQRKKEEAEKAAIERAKKRKKMIVITTSAVAVCIAFVILLTTVIIPNIKYNEAIKMIDNGEIVNAYESLIALNGYKDSKRKADEIFEQYKTEKFKVAVTGDYIYFGNYEQDNNTSNGKEDIEWLILAKEGNKALLISKYALDCQPYNTEDVAITWETCSLRGWLNGTFINNAFSTDEQKNIISSTVTADENPEYDTNPGNNTKDKVFLLSIDEANTYFASDTARQCEGTKYCYAQGADESSSGNCWWWLRSPGYDSGPAAFVDSDGSHSAAGVRSDGSVCDSGDYVDGGSNAVRPALWIDLSN